MALDALTGEHMLWREVIKAKYEMERVYPVHAQSIPAAGSIVVKERKLT